MTVKARDRQTGEEEGETITLFKAVPVFCQEQVAPLASGDPTGSPLASGDPVALEAPHQPLTGDSHAHCCRCCAGSASRWATR